MEFRQLVTDLYVAGQIAVEDVEAAAMSGIRTIICNRPDHETDDQPATELLANAAARFGIEFRHIPISSGNFNGPAIDEFHAILQSGDRPILAYCRSGMRSTCLWALASAKEVKREEILTAAAAAGYDLAPLADAIDSRRDQPG